MYLTTYKFWSIPRLSPCIIFFFPHSTHPWSELNSYDFKYCIYPNTSQSVSPDQWTLCWYIINSTAFKSQRCFFNFIYSKRHLVSPQFKLIPLKSSSSQYKWKLHRYHWKCGSQKICTHRWWYVSWKCHRILCLCLFWFL